MEVQGKARESGQQSKARTLAQVQLWSQKVEAQGGASLSFFSQLICLHRSLVHGAL